MDKKADSTNVSNYTRVTVHSAQNWLIKHVYWMHAQNDFSMFDSLNQGS